ncbi:MAG: exodeoxyribonuclease V subunit gamma [Alistipes sp.]|nr:exodeoxyribonuclease V subunit gamma [Alistipes sp.]
MKTFLQEVAHDLYARYGDRVSECEVLFPSHRAYRFFMEALGEEADRPIWQPKRVTMDRLMCELAGLQVGDRLRLLTELYRIYARHHDEPFDRFYFWGEMLLADFDTIDKYCIDASQLFRNIEDIKQIEADLSYLTPRQLEILRFWSTLGDAENLSNEKRRFLEIWRTLLPIYTAYRKRLATLGFAYNGMVQRAASERIAAGDYTFDTTRHFVVAGFNALSTCERRLFKFLQTAAHTDFYWDYDAYYEANPKQEAGMFIRQNLLDFPPAAALSHNAMAQPKKLTAVATTSNAVQCKYVATILGEWMQSGKLDKETAIVLTDENLLMPLLYALPKDLGKVNVTMGYPLRQTPAYTFIERLIELQAHGRKRGEGYAFYHVDVVGLLTHPYLLAAAPQVVADLRNRIVKERLMTVDAALLGEADALLAKLFRRAAGWQDFSNWLTEVLSAMAKCVNSEEDSARQVEFLAVAVEEITKLRNSLSQCEIEVSDEVYVSLLRRHLQTVRVPFDGEPLEGVQVMGILETRNLDFKRVVILSMTDANFPGNHLSQSSYVPYALRAAYELPTPEHHEGVYAYYFYRLIQRAEEVVMLYCARADEKSTGEQSRYIRQLDYESGFKLHRVEVGVDVHLAYNSPIEVEKDAEVMRRLEHFISDDPNSQKSLSPTALYRYVACPLRFYFHSVAHLRVEDEISEELDAPMFGTILHAAMEELYKAIQGVPAPIKELQAMRQSTRVEEVVDQAIAEHYLCDLKATVADFSGTLLLARDIVVRYIRDGVLKHDLAHPHFTVAHREHKVAYAFPFKADGRERTMNFAGIADRIDTLADGRLRVVDYKTGVPHLEFNGLEALFKGSAEERRSNILQTLLYSMMLSRTNACDVQPALYYVRQIHTDGYAPQLVDTQTGDADVSYQAYAEEFECLLREALEELYDPTVPFTQCEDEKSCAYCDFKELCRRG